MRKPEIRTDQGWSEVILNNECDISEFYKAAELLETGFHVFFTSKMNDSDSFYWDFLYNNKKITIHHNIYLGLSIYPTEFSKATFVENQAAVRIGQSLFEILQAR